jgi:uncharacterized membrane protein
MAAALDENALARCLAAFLERDQLREQNAALRNELDAIKAELAKLTETGQEHGEEKTAS